MTATASPPHPTAPAHNDPTPSQSQLEPPATIAAQNGHSNSDDSSDSLSDLDDQFDDASDFDGVNSSAFFANGSFDASSSNHTNDHDLTGDEPPPKRQRTGESTPPPRPRQKPVSPPWKKVEAEGPTSFIENGRRKSGRTNLLPSETQPGGNKRQPRPMTHNVNGSAPKATARTPVNGQINGSKNLFVNNQNQWVARDHHQLRLPNELWALGAAHALSDTMQAMQTQTSMTMTTNLGPNPLKSSSDSSRRLYLSSTRFKPTSCLDRRFHDLVCPRPSPSTCIVHLISKFQREAGLTQPMMYNTTQTSRSKKMLG